MKKIISYHPIFYDDWLNFEILNRQGEIELDLKILTEEEVTKIMNKLGFKRDEYIIIKQTLEVV